MGSSAYENNVSRLWREVGSKTALKTHRWQAQTALAWHHTFFVLLFCISRFQPQWPRKRFMTRAGLGEGRRTVSGPFRARYCLTESAPPAAASPSPRHGRWSPGHSQRTPRLPLHVPSHFDSHLKEGAFSSPFAIWSYCTDNIY